jgi:hypothetical protein
MDVRVSSKATYDSRAKTRASPIIAGVKTSIRLEDDELDAIRMQLNTDQAAILIEFCA